MKQEGKKEQLINWILAGGFVVTMMLIIGSLFDYYYDLNDDGLMKDILAGVYTGTPEGHNIQMLWPVSALISVFTGWRDLCPGMACFCAAVILAVFSDLKAES